MGLDLGGPFACEVFLRDHEPMGPIYSSVFVGVIGSSRIGYRVDIGVKNPYQSPVRLVLFDKSAM